MKYVYTLKSLSHSDKYYTGLTNNLEPRLAAHNAGEVLHTSKFKPWKIETCTFFSDPSKALAFEKYLKSGSGRAFAKRHF